MIFVDTGAWFALFVKGSIGHEAVSKWVAQNRETLLTTDYVIDETLTLLRARQQQEAAIAAGKTFFETQAAQVHFLTAADIEEAWQIFSQFSDKEWSFTDCTSKAIMQRLGIVKALTFDHHFRQFGSI